MITFKLDEFFDNQSFSKGLELYNQITEQRFFVSHTGVNYRTINHWDEKGLIQCTRRKEGGDRRFSFADFVWLKIVKDLRSFGVPIVTIKKFKDDIYSPLPVKEMFESFFSNPKILDGFEGADKEHILEFIKNKEYEKMDNFVVRFTFLHLLVADAIIGREPVSLVIFKEGDWFPYNPLKESLYSEEIINRKRFSSHISICLLDVIFQFFQSETIIRFMKDFKLLSASEQKILDLAKTGNYKKIKVVYKTKKYNLLEIKKSKTVLTKLLQIIRDRQYEEFIIVDSKGLEYKVKEI